ncbi:MAG: Ig-like domain-containing protein [Marinifilaceae bacterium]
MKKLILIGLSLLLVLTYSCKDNDDLKIKATQIIINPSTLNLVEGGDKFLVHAYVLPTNTDDKAIKWSIEDVKIATIDAKGNVKPLKVGSTKIQATSSNNVKVTCQLNVSKNVIELQELAINESTDEGISITVGDKKNLTLKLTPSNATNKNIKWESTNNEIAIVEHGTITALKVGKVSIYAIAPNGIRTKCKVNIKEKEIKATAIKIHTDKATIKLGAKKVLNILFTPLNSTNRTIIWTSSDKKIATVASTGQVISLTAGKTTITATSDNALVSTCEITIIP